MENKNIHEIEGYKKVNLEEFRLINKGYKDKWEFDSFPSDGLWTVETKKSSRSTSCIIDIKKYEELPQKYPLVELALRKDDLASAIMKFIDSKNKSLLDFGKCSYSVNEFAEFIIKYFLSQEYGGGSKKFLIEKKWIKVEGTEHKRSWEI
jgi:hypothetical protein